MKRNLYLDVIRGFLSWAIVLIHIAWISGYEKEVSWHLGAYAVEGFMVLSGYVITQLLITKQEPYLHFLIRRFLRLFPAFAVCVILTLLFRPITAGHYANSLSVEASEVKFFWWHLGAHALLLHGLIPTAWLPEAMSAFSAVGWSLSVEWQFYLIVPLVIASIMRYRLRAFLLIAGVSMICLHNPIESLLGRQWTGAFLPQQMGYFIVGVGLYFLTTAPLLAAVIPIPFILPRFFVWLGTISYSTYVLHWLILAVVNAFLPELSRKSHLIIISLISIPLILPLSYLLHRFVEQPGIAFGRYLVQIIKDSKADEVVQIDTPTVPR